MHTQRNDHGRPRDRELIQAIGLATLIAFGVGAPAMADGIVPDQYQGVWAAARDCQTNFQNILPDIVNRRFAACRVTQVSSSGSVESHTNGINLDCEGSPSREIWHAETIEGADYLVVIPAAGSGEPSIDMYKRCAEIPLSEIPLSDVPGNPAPETASEVKSAPPPRAAPTVRRHPPPHSHANRIHKHRLQQ